MCHKFITLVKGFLLMQDEIDCLRFKVQTISRISEEKADDHRILQECEKKIWSIAILREFHCHLFFFKTQLENQLFRECLLLF